MKKRITFVSLVAAALLSSIFFPAPCESADKLNIVTTHTVLKSIAEEIGGDNVSVSSLATGREDPHAMQARPSYMVAARRADLFIKIGMELEIGYERLVVDGSRNYNIRLGQPGHLDASLSVLRLEVPTTRVDRSMGDVHPLGNPHYWLDPYNARTVADAIGTRLEELDPTNKTEYHSNKRAFHNRLDTKMFGSDLVESMGGDRLWALALEGRLKAHLNEQGKESALGGWFEKMEPLWGKELITYHRSWGYFTNRFGLEVVEELEPKPGIPPSPGHVRKVIEVAKQRQIKLILMEPYYNRKPAEFVAAKAGAMLVEAANAVGGQPGVDDYFSLIDNIINRLLKGNKDGV